MNERFWLWLSDVLVWIGAWRAPISSWRWQAYSRCIELASDAHWSQYPAEPPPSDEPEDARW